MEFDDEVIWFNIYEAMRFPSDVQTVHMVELIDILSQETLEYLRKDKLEISLTRSLI